MSAWRGSARKGVVAAEDTGPLADRNKAEVRATELKGRIAEAGYVEAPFGLVELEAFVDELLEITRSIKENSP